MHHVPGSINPADIGTRGLALLSDLGPSSTWQVGPDFLRTPYSLWIADGSEKARDITLPVEETRTVLAVSTAVPCYGLLQVLTDALLECSALGLHVQSLVDEALSREKLEVLTHSLARALSAVLKNDRAKCAAAPSPRMLELSVRLMVIASSSAVRTACKEGKLESLGALCRGGIVWISGCVRGERLAELLGTTELPVLTGTEQLSRSILGKAHRQDHRRNPRDIAARTRRLAWIVGAV